MFNAQSFIANCDWNHRTCFICWRWAFFLCISLHVLTYLIIHLVFSLQFLIFSLFLFFLFFLLLLGFGLVLDFFFHFRYFYFTSPSRLAPGRKASASSAGDLGITLCWSHNSFIFSSRGHRSAWKGPYVLRPVSQQSPQGCLRNSANICLVEHRSLSILESGKSTASFSTPLFLQAINVAMLWPVYI